MNAKPCPFCGREPVYDVRPSDFTDSGKWHVFSCFCGGKTACVWKAGATRAIAFELWNTRKIEL